MAATAADVTVPLPSTSAWGVDVLGDIVAISTTNDGVLIYTGISSLNASSVPTNVLDAGFFPRKLKFDNSGRLYVRSSTPMGIQVFVNVTAVTTRYTLLTQVAPSPVDFILLK